MIKNSKRLMWNIFIFLLGFCALLLTILWLFQTVFLDQMYKGIRKGEIKKAIILVEENINSPSLEQILIELAEEQEIIVTPLHDFVPPVKPGPRDTPPMREAITETRSYLTSDGRVVSLVFYAIISPVTATISTIKIQLYYVTIIMLVLSVALALIIAGMVARPIESLNSSAKKLAEGIYDIRFSGGGYKEINELSDTLNHAALELSKVEKLRRELMANISHDLRTPLALIYGYAEIMHDFPDEINPEQTKLIMDETERLASLVNDILHVSRLESGAMELNSSIYNFTESMGRSIDRLTKLVGKEGYSFIFEHDEDVFVKADEIKMTQVFYNLLINAIHYSTDDLQIIVRQISSDTSVKIEVEDHGEGINEEDIPYIWDRYYKAGEKHKRAITGTGLGLSIVKKIVELHGGSCGVESKPGAGSIFWFKIDTSMPDTAEV